MLALYLSVVFGAAILQGLAGFGFGLVCMGILPLFLPTRVAVVLISVLRAAPVATTLVQLRRDVSLRRVAPLLVGAVGGVPLGVWFLTSASPTAVRLALGVVLTGYALWALARPRPTDAPPREPGRGWALLAGWTGGVLGGGFNTGGPPVVLYAAIAGWQKDVLRASLASYFVTVISLQLSLFAGSGILTWPLLQVQLLALPLVVLGTWIGNLLAGRVPQATFQRGLLLLILVLGGVYLTRAVRALTGW
ncbi:MAG: sulfite exporter TauE/SafE family protein [Planctomycetota bacterium]